MYCHQSSKTCSSTDYDPSFTLQPERTAHPQSCANTVFKQRLSLPRLLNSDLWTTPFSSVPTGTTLQFQVCKKTILRLSFATVYQELVEVTTQRNLDAGENFRSRHNLQISEGIFVSSSPPTWESGAPCFLQASQQHPATLLPLHFQMTSGW